MPNNIKLNRDGFSMVTIMVFALVMAGGALTMSKRLLSTKKLIKSESVNNDIDVLLQDIRGLLASVGACNNSFLGQNAANSTGHSLQDTSANTVLTAGMNLKWTGLTVTDLSLDGTDANVVTGGTGTTHLMVTLNRGNMIFGTKVIKKPITINVTVDASNLITGCFAVSEGGEEDIWSKDAATGVLSYNTRNVGVGTNNPVITMDLGGALRVGEETNTCDADRRGAVRMNPGNTKLSLCDGSTWKLIDAYP